MSTDPTPESGRVPLDPLNPEHVRAVSRLHAELLPDSPISHLGPGFRERFYYRVLPRKNLIRCDLYRIAGEFVAFIVYTDDPFGFMKKGMMRTPFVLVTCLLGSILGSPRRLKTILKVRRLGRIRAQHLDSNAAEILSMGVRLTATTRVDAGSGLRVPHALFGYATEVLRKVGKESVQMVIRDDNLASLMFFSSLGARMCPGDYAPSGHKVLVRDLASC